MATFEPDHVIIEKVERNISDFVTSPAIIPAPGHSVMRLKNLSELSGANVKVDYCMADRRYAEVSRVAYPSCADPDHGYYEITWSDGTKTYEEY